MINGGWQLWRRFIDTGMAWDGTDEPHGDAVMLDANPSLGFTRVVARRL